MSSTSSTSLNISNCNDCGQYFLDAQTALYHCAKMKHHVTDKSAGSAKWFQNRLNNPDSRVRNMYQCKDCGTVISSLEEMDNHSSNNKHNGRREFKFDMDSEPRHNHDD